MGVTFPTFKGCADEGRLVTVEYPGFYVVGAYVPNSGMNLDRYRGLPVLVQIISRCSYE